MKKSAPGVFGLFIGFQKQGDSFPEGRRLATSVNGLLRFVCRPPDDNPIGRKYYDYLAAEFPGREPVEKQKALTVLTKYTGCPIGARLNLTLLCRDGFIEEIPVVVVAPELAAA